MLPACACGIFGLPQRQRRRTGFDNTPCRPPRAPPGTSLRQPCCRRRAWCAVRRIRPCATAAGAWCGAAGRVPTTPRTRLNFCRRLKRAGDCQRLTQEPCCRCLPPDVTPAALPGSCWPTKTMDAPTSALSCAPCWPGYSIMLQRMPAAAASCWSRFREPAVPSGGGDTARWACSFAPSGPGACSPPTRRWNRLFGRRGQGRRRCCVPGSRPALSRGVPEAARSASDEKGAEPMFTEL